MTSAQIHSAITSLFGGVCLVLAAFHGASRATRAAPALYLTTRGPVPPQQVEARKASPSLRRHVLVRSVETRSGLAIPPGSIVWHWVSE